MPSPLHLHLLLEIPASIAFFLSPSSTLALPQPPAHAVIRQYAVLLLATNIIAYSLLSTEAKLAAAGPAFVREQELLGGLARGVKGAFAVYHVAPFVRALGKVRQSLSERKEVSKRDGVERSSSRGEKDGIVGQGEDQVWLKGYVFAAVHAVCASWLTRDALL